MASTSSSLASARASGVVYVESRVKRMGRAMMPFVLFQRMACTTSAYRLFAMRSWIRPKGAGCRVKGRLGGGEGCEKGSRVREGGRMGLGK